MGPRVRAAEALSATSWNGSSAILTGDVLDAFMRVTSDIEITLSELAMCVRSRFSVGSAVALGERMKLLLTILFLSVGGVVACTGETCNAGCLCNSADSCPSGCHVAQTSDGGKFCSNGDPDASAD